MSWLLFKRASAAAAGVELPAGQIAQTGSPTPTRPVRRQEHCRCTLWPCIVAPGSRALKACLVGLSSCRINCMQRIHACRTAFGKYVSAHLTSRRGDCALWQSGPNYIGNCTARCQCAPRVQLTVWMTILLCRSTLQIKHGRSERVQLTRRRISVRVSQSMASVTVHVQRRATLK